MNKKQQAINQQTKVQAEIKPISYNKLVLVGLLLLTLIVFWPSRQNNLTNWDDKTYVTENPYIRTLHGDSTASTINYHFTNFIFANYHPFTTLTYAVIYNQSELDPALYHTVNILLHVANVLLVFLLIWGITKQQIVAFTTAIIFALHPMHVESVVWISELKDVLFTFFYLLSLLMYWNYLDKSGSKAKYFTLALLFFIFSLFSKGMAVTLPILLVGMDYFKGRSVHLKTILEKVPFFALSIVFGLIAISAQKSANAVADMQNISFFERLFLSCYALCLYVYKFVLPINLSCFYAYPTKIGGTGVPLKVYLSIIPVLGAAFILFKWFRFNRLILFGTLIFLGSIAIVLQLLPVGDAVIAERYTYIPYIGLGLILGHIFQQISDGKLPKATALKNVISPFLVVITIVFAFSSFQRSKVWENSLILWSDAIEKDPTVSRQYRSRGDAYEMELKMHKEAIIDYTKSIELNPYYDDAYYNRGIALYYNQQFKEALADYNKAFEINPTAKGRHFNRAITYHTLNQLENALKEYDLAIREKETSPDIFYNRGLCLQQLKKNQLAIEDFNVAIEQNPSNAAIYNRLGLSYFFLKQYDKALQNYSKSIALQNNVGEVYNNRSGIYYMNKEYKKALEDALNAQRLKFPINPAYIAELQNAIK